MATMLVRVRTPIGMWRMQGLKPKSKVKDLVKLIEDTHNVSVAQLGLSPKYDPSLLDSQALNSTLKAAGIKNADIVYAKIGGKDKEKNTTVIVGGKRVDIDGDGKMITAESKNGLRPGLQSLRTQGLDWDLTKLIEFDEQYTFQVPAEKRKFCAQASLDSKSCQSIQQYMSSTGFTTSRCAILYGTFIDSEKEKERKEQEAAEKARKAAQGQGYGKNKRQMKLSDLPAVTEDFDAKQAVRVEAIYEPPQENTTSGFTLLEDDREKKVDAIAEALGLYRVGFLIAHPARTGYRFSTDEILAASLHALEATDGKRESPFVTITVSPDEGFEAWTINPVCLDMFAEGALMESESPGISAVVEKFVAIVEAKEAKVIDNDLFIQRVPIVQHDSAVSGSGTFPRYNRTFAEAPKAAAVKNALKGIGRNPTPVDLARALSDFHVLIYLSEIFDINEGLVQISKWVGEVAFKGNKNPGELPEGYKMLIMNMAGLD